MFLEVGERERCKRHEAAVKVVEAPKVQAAGRRVTVPQVMDQPRIIRITRGSTTYSTVIKMKYTWYHSITYLVPLYYRIRYFTLPMSVQNTTFDHNCTIKQPRKIVLHIQNAH